MRVPGAAAAAAGAAAGGNAAASADARAASAWGDEVDDFLQGRFRTNRFGVRPRVQLEIMSGGKLRWFLAITAAVLLCYAVLTSYGSDLRWDCVDLCGRPCDPDSAGVGLFGDARDAALAAHACATQVDVALALPAGVNATVFSLRTALPFGGRDAEDGGSLGSAGDELFCASRYDYDIVLAVRLAGLRAHAAGVLAAPSGWSGGGDAEIEFYTVATLYVVDPGEADPAVVRQASQAIWETPVAPGVVGGSGDGGVVGANATHFSVGPLAYPRAPPAPGPGGRYLHYNRVDRHSFGCASFDDDDAGGGSTEWEVARSEPVGDGAEGVWMLRVDVVFPGVVLKADAPSLDAVLLKRSRKYVVAEGSVQLVLLAWCLYLLPYFLWKNFARPSMLGEWLTVQVWIACMLLSLAIYLNPVFLPGLAARGDTSRTARAFVFFEILFPEVYFVVFSGFMQVIPLSVGLQAIRAAWVRVQYRADGTGGGLFIPSLLVAAGCAAGIVEEARRFHPVNGRAEEGLRWERNTELRSAGMGVLAVGAGVVLVAAIFCRVTLRSTTYTVAKYRVLTYRVFLAYVLPSAVVYSAVTTYRWAPRTRAALHRATRSSPHLQDKLLLSTLILVLSHLFSPVFSVRKNAPPPPHTREWLSTRWRPEWKAWVTEFGKSLYFFITEDEERTYAQAEDAGSAAAAAAQQPPTAPPPGMQAGTAAGGSGSTPAALRKRGGGGLRRRSAGGKQQQQEEEEEGAGRGENGSVCSSSGTGPQATHRSLVDPLAGAGADREPLHEPIHFYRIGAHELEDLGLENSAEAGSGGGLGVGGSGGGSALLPRAHTSSSSLPSPLATTHAQGLSGTSPALLHHSLEAPPPGVALPAAGTEGNVSFAVSTLAVRARSQLLSNLMRDGNASTASTASSGYNTSRSTHSHSRTMPLGQLPPALERASSFDGFDEGAVEEDEEAAATGDDGSGSSSGGDDGGGNGGGGGALFQDAGGLLSPAATAPTSPPVSPPQAPLLQGGASLAVLGGLGELEQPALGDVRRAQRRRRMSRHVSPLAGDAMLSPYTPMKRLPFVGPVLEGGSLLFQQTPSSAGTAAAKKDGDAKAAGEGDVSIAIPPSADDSAAKPTAAAAASGSDAEKKRRAEKKKKKKKKKNGRKNAKEKPTNEPYGNDSSSSSSDGAGDEGERHPIFCLESAIECFNASWLSYMPDDKQSFHDSTYLQRGDLDSHVEWFADFSRVPSFLRSTTRAENHAKCVWFLRGVEEAQLHGLPTHMRWVQAWAPGGTRRDLLLGRRGGVVGSRSEAGDWDVPEDRHRLSWRAAEAWRSVAQLLRTSVEAFEVECAPASPPSSPVRARSAEGSPTRSGRGGGAGEEGADEDVASPASLARRPVWQDDKSCERCPQPGCSARFSLTTRKHHCRRCGRIYCEPHTRGRAALPALGYPEPVRVCAACMAAMREGQKAEREATRAAASPPCERASARWSELLRALKERLKGVRRAKLFLSHEAGGGAGGGAAAEAGDDAAAVPHTSAEDFSQRAAFLMGQVWVMCNAPHRCRPPPASRRGSRRNVNNLTLSGLGGFEEGEEKVEEEGKAVAAAAAATPAAAVAAVACVVVESLFCSIPGQRAVFAMLVRDLAALLGGGLGGDGAADADTAAPFARPFVACDLLSEEGIAHFGGSTGVVVEALELLKRCNVLVGGEEDSPQERGHRSRSLRVSFDGSRWRLRPVAASAVVAECGVDAGWAEAAAGGGELARWSRVRLAMMMSSVGAYPGHALPRCVEMSELGGVPGFELAEEPIHAEFYGYKLEAAVTVRSCDLKAIVLSSPSRVVVAFRGTDSTANVMVDIALCPAEFKPHDGFLSMFGNAKTAVEKTVCCACCSAPPADPRRENAGAAAEDGGGGRSARCCGPGFVKARLGRYHRALFGKKPEVHLGFLSAWQAMEQDVLNVLSNVCPVDDPRPLFCTGHSLGGAMAQIAAYSLTWKLYELQKQPRVYVFGCPRVGNFNFALAYNALVPDTFRVNVNGDPFTNVPPSFGRARYWHAGVEVHLSRHERVSWCIDPTWLDSGCVPMPYPLSHLMRNIKKQLNRMVLLFNPRFLAFNKALVPSGMAPKYLKYIVDDPPNEEGLKRSGYFWPWCRVTRPDISSLAAAATQPVPFCCESASGNSSAG